MRILKVAGAVFGVVFTMVSGASGYTYARHWQGVGGTGVGDYNVPSNWSEGFVPALDDLAAFNNTGNKNWLVTFTEDVTNEGFSVVAPAAAYESIFNLNQHTYWATNSFNTWQGAGGRVTLTNGTLRALALNCETAPIIGSTPTNHAVIAFKNVRSESALARVSGTFTSFEGGEHSVSSSMTVGAAADARAYATVCLSGGTRFGVTNELRVGDAAGATGRMDVAEAEFRMGNRTNYLGVVVRSKGTLTIGAGANVFSGGPLYVGNSGHGVLEQTGGICSVSNGFDLGENAGSRGELKVQGGQFSIRDLRPSVINYFRVGVIAGATGEVTLAGGSFSYTGEACAMGRSGYGKMGVTGGTNFFGNNFMIGSLIGGIGEMTVLGGTNTFSSASGARLQVGGYGRGSLLCVGGTNSVCNFAVANDAGSSGTMTVSNGLWTVTEHSWVGNSGNGTLTINGGEMRYFKDGAVLSIGRYAGATGEVTVAGGLVDMLVNGEVWVGRGDQTKSSGRLVLTGTGVLRTKQIFEKIASSSAASQILFDGGTLKASVSGALVYDVDDVRLTANGMVVDSAGYTVSVVPTLQDAAGQAGGITKKGAGTLTLAGARTATGPVSVLGGTLVVSNDVAVAAGVSRVDGTLVLTAAYRLTVGAGAALAGTGTVARVTLQDNAVCARDRADGAFAPLTVGDCVAEDRLTIALTGYSFTELKTPVPLIRSPTAFIAPSKVTVTLNGQPNTFLRAKFVEAGGQQVLTVSYLSGTLISVL